MLTRAGYTVHWYGPDDGALPSEAKPYAQFSADFESLGSVADAILVAEHLHPVDLLSGTGLLSPERIIQVNPVIRIGVIAGKVDALALRNTGLYVYPDNIAPFGYMSYQAYRVGLRPVLKLFTAGLKVGELMARARLSGLLPVAAAQRVLQNPLAQDFQGEQAWLSSTS
jgi:hypothetical protein